MAKELISFLNFKFEQKQVYVKSFSGETLTEVPRYIINWREYQAVLASLGIKHSVEDRPLFQRYISHKADESFFNDMIAFQHEIRAVLEELIVEKRLKSDAYSKIFKDTNGLPMTVVLEGSEDITPLNLPHLKFHYDFIADTYRLCILAILRSLIINGKIFNFAQDESGCFYMDDEVLSSQPCAEALVEYSGEAATNNEALSEELSLPNSQKHGDNQELIEYKPANLNKYEAQEDLPIYNNDLESASIPAGSTDDHMAEESETLKEDILIEDDSEADASETTETLDMSPELDVEIPEYDCIGPECTILLEHSLDDTTKTDHSPLETCHIDSSFEAPDMQLTMEVEIEDKAPLEVNNDLASAESVTDFVSCIIDSTEPETVESQFFFRIVPEDETAREVVLPESAASGSCGTNVMTIANNGLVQPYSAEPLAIAVNSAIVPTVEDKELTAEKCVNDDELLLTIPGVKQQAAVSKSISLEQKVATLEQRRRKQKKKKNADERQASFDF